MRLLILGTGLIGASLGLALKSLSLSSPDSMQESTIAGWDADPRELAQALAMGALDTALPDREAALAKDVADIYILATPVLPILDWMQRLAPVLGPDQLVTDVGSTKREIAALAERLYNQPGRARFLPGHPMAGKESGGAALAEAALFRPATWLFTPLRGNEITPGDGPVLSSPPASPASVTASSSRLEEQWRNLVGRIGAQILDLDPERHDEVCAWVSHLPQMLSTALAALLQDRFAGDPQGLAALQAIGGRALRETTRLGRSPYSMWRDIALTNTAPIAETLSELEQRLAHVRENLRTPELRDEFATANRFRPAKTS